MISNWTGEGAGALLIRDDKLFPADVQTIPGTQWSLLHRDVVDSNVEVVLWSTENELPSVIFEITQSGF